MAPQEQQSRKIYSPWWKSPFPWIISVIASSIAFAIGWFLPSPAQPPALPLRETGYQFISPLLTCNNIKNFPETQSLSNKIESVINQHIAAGDISKASTFFGDFSNGHWSDTFPDEKYYPSSLGKVPIMIAYFEAAEANPDILNQTITYTAGAPDLNLSQDIPVSHSITPGQSYTVNELIKYMIDDSDNNAAQLLFLNIDKNALRNIYNELQIPVNDDATLSNLDFITPQQVTTMFRVLYNATLLSKDDSEKALQLLSKTTFEDGLVAGVPSSTVVAHKFGIVSIQPNGVTTEHELHDCGIIYAPNHPYTFCIMTRGSSDLADMEATITDISKTVYQAVESGQ